MRTCVKREVDEAEFNKFVEGRHNLWSNGDDANYRVYVERVAMRGGWWNKSVAVRDHGKFILIEDT